MPLLPEPSEYERKRHAMQRTGPQGEGAYRALLEAMGQATEPVLRPLATTGAQYLGEIADQNATGAMFGDPDLMSGYDPGYSESLPDAAATASPSAYGEAAMDVMPGPVNPQDYADLEAAISGTDERVPEGEAGHELSPFQRWLMGGVGVLGSTLGLFGTGSAMRAGVRSIDAPVKSPGDRQMGTFGGRRGQRPADIGPHDRYSKPGPFGREVDDDWMQREARALEMDRAGSSREEIFEETGLFRQADGEWVYEIDDRGAVDTFNPGAFEGSTAYKSATLGDLIPGWRGFENYPDMRDIEVNTRAGGGADISNRGRFRVTDDAPMDSIGISSKMVQENPQKAARYLIHEAQHAIQAREGFPGQGASVRGMQASGPWANPRGVEFARDPDVQRYHDLSEQLRGGPGAFESSKDYSRALYEAIHLKPEIQKRYGISPDSGIPRQMRFFEPYDAYRREAGEVMSRLSENRAEMTPDERQQVPPYRMYDVDEREIISDPETLENVPRSIEDEITDGGLVDMGDGTQRRVRFLAGDPPPDPGPRDQSRPSQIPEGKRLHLLGPDGHEVRGKVRREDDEVVDLMAPLHRPGQGRVLFSGELSDLTPEENARRTQAVAEELEDRGVPYRRMLGRYKAEGDETGVDEDSFMVPFTHQDEAREIARAMGQESVLEVNEKGKGGLYFPDDDSVMPLGSGRIVPKGERVENSTVDPETGAEYTFDAEPEFEGRKFGKSTIRDPQRKMFPGIYDDPRQIALEAEQRVPDEDPVLGELFGVTRSELARMAEVPAEEPGSWPGRPRKPRGSAAADRVMKPENARRLRELLEAGREYAPRMTEGMSGWYEMRPVYERLIEMHGKEEGERLFKDLMTYQGMASPGSDVISEISRGTFANMMQKQGRLQEFVDKFEHQGIPGHPYHRTAHGGPMLKYEESGSIQSKYPKVPVYVQSSMTEELGRQTDVPVGDAHWSRGVGLADARTSAKPEGSVSTPEMTALAPWYRDEVASKAGHESVPAQANQWGLLGSRTGVDTEVGIPKLELLAKQIRKTAKRENIPLEEARDRVLSGKSYAGKIDPELLLYMAAGFGGAGLLGGARQDRRDDRDEER